MWVRENRTEQNKREYKIALGGGEDMSCSREAPEPVLWVEGGLVLYPGHVVDLTTTMNVSSAGAKPGGVVWALRGGCDDRTMQPPELGVPREVPGPAVSSIMTVMTVMMNAAALLYICTLQI